MLLILFDGLMGGKNFYLHCCWKCDIVEVDSAVSLNSISSNPKIYNLGILGEWEMLVLTIQCLYWWPHILFYFFCLGLLSE